MVALNVDDNTLCHGLLDHRCILLQTAGNLQFLENAEAVDKRSLLDKKGCLRPVTVADDGYMRRMRVKIDCMPQLVGQDDHEVRQ